MSGVCYGLVLRAPCVASIVSGEVCRGSVLRVCAGGGAGVWVSDGSPSPQ